MTIKVGDVSLPIRRPQDLDAALIETTGCSAIEVAGMLRGSPLAHLVARAVHPFLNADKGEVPTVYDLAEMIAKAGVEAVLPAARALYASHPAIDEAAS